MPTPSDRIKREEYNLYVPDLTNAYLDGVKKAEPAGDIGTNGTGRKKHPLRVGQPVLVNFLGDKQQPFIQDSLPFSGENVQPGLDQRTERGAWFPNPGTNNPLIETFSASGEVNPAILRRDAPTQPQNSPVNIEVPGNHRVEGDDGYSYEFGLNTSFMLRPGENYTVEGKRKSMITNPKSNGQILLKRASYELNRKLNRVYGVVEGQYTPKEIRAGVEGNDIQAVATANLEGINDLLERIDQAVQETVDWFEENIAALKDIVFDVWSDLFTEEEIKAPMGLELIQAELNILGFFS
ncbi:MAG: hypothetical protein ABEK59_12825, partial [Halobacteria archaeon]